MDEIEAETDIRGLDQYELLLRNRFPERCVNVLLTYLRPAMDRATNRKAYWSVVQVLRKLRRYSETEAKTMAAEWKMKYPRRTAMLDELEMAGF